MTCDRCSQRKTKYKERCSMKSTHRYIVNCSVKFLQRYKNFTRCLDGLTRQFLAPLLGCKSWQILIISCNYPPHHYSMMWCRAYTRTHKWPVKLDAWSFWKSLSGKIYQEARFFLSRFLKDTLSLPLCQQEREHTLSE